MDAYYRTFDVLLEDQIPRLYSHMKQQCLSHDIYLIDWYVVSLYSSFLFSSLFFTFLLVKLQRFFPFREYL